MTEKDVRIKLLETQLEEAREQQKAEAWGMIEQGYKRLAELHSGRKYDCDRRHYERHAEHPGVCRHFCLRRAEALRVQIGQLGAELVSAPSESEK